MTKKKFEDVLSEPGDKLPEPEDKFRDRLSERADVTDPPIGEGGPTPPFQDPAHAPAYVIVDAVQLATIAPSMIVELYPKLFRVHEIVDNTVSLVKTPAVGDQPAIPYSFYELRVELALRPNVEFPPLKLVSPPLIPDETA